MCGLFSNQIIVLLCVRMTLTFSLQWICWRLSLWDVDDAVNIERDLFARGGPVLITEAVCEFAVMMCGEGVISGGY